MTTAKNQAAGQRAEAAKKEGLLTATESEKLLTRMKNAQKQPQPARHQLI